MKHRKNRLAGHGRASSRLVGRSVVAIAAATAMGMGVTPAVHAEEANLEELFSELEEKSQQAGEKNEAVKALEEEVAAATANFEEAQATLESSLETARQAERALAVRQMDARKLVETSSRLVDSGLSFLSGGQVAPEASAETVLEALGTTNSKALRALGGMVDKHRAAADKAAQDLAVEEFRKIELDFQLSELNEERDALTARIDEITEIVDAFTPAELQAWQARNNPVSSEVVEEIVTVVQDVVGQGAQFVARAPQAPAAQLGTEVAASDNAAAVNFALSKVGAPYAWGATGPDAFDCSGLMVWSYMQIGKSLPRTSQAQMAGGTPVDLSALQPGDIIGYYEGFTHVGMYIGDGKIVHAADYGIPVQVVPLDYMPVYGAVRY